MNWRAWSAAALATGAALLLAACMVTPGKFESTLDIRRDGRFTYSYTGEIFLLALSDLADMANSAGDGEFSATSCWNESDFEERPCTDEELAQQRADWEAGREARKAKSQREAESMRAMLGGLDPSDPKAAEELAERLRRQVGWNRVEYRGDGLFYVEFAISSRLGHDFSFPTFERFSMSTSFISATLRKGGAVRVDAPGFSARGGDNPMAGMMAGMAGLAGASAAGAEPEGGEAAGMPPIPQMDGTFRIITDGQIMANNTDEGPRPAEGGQVLEWTVNARTQSPPMALIQLAE
ncbi:conserved hypothetical protein [Altererythrobacter sp. B11]|nr:conserved hypothetical protein [Altererythrobacter sp. B11]